MNINKENMIQKLTPLLFILLLGAAFYLGKLQTEVSMLKNNLGGAAGTGTGTANAPTGGNAAIDMVAYAKNAGVKERAFNKCYEERYSEMEELVKSDLQEGTSVGIRGTPGVILLDTQTGLTSIVPGAVPYEMLKDYIDDLKNGVDSNAANFELEGGEELKQLTEMSKNVPHPSEDDHYLGSLDSRYAMIEYSDYECPYCAKFHPTTKQALAEYDDLVMVYRHFPLDQIHPNARPLAVASECVAAEGGNDAFWAFTDQVFGVN